MKKIEITLYKFSELSEESKKVAIGHKRDIDCEFHWFYDYLNSLKSGLKFFNFELKDYSIDWGTFEFCEFEIKASFDDSILSLYGIRLYKYIVNNYDIKNLKDCPFTGYCGDEDFLAPVRDFLKKPYDITFEHLMEKCCERLIKSGCDDYEHQISDERISEQLENSDDYFTINGNYFKI